MPGGTRPDLEMQFQVSGSPANQNGFIGLGAIYGPLDQQMRPLVEPEFPQVYFNHRPKLSTKASTKPKRSTAASSWA